MIGGIAAGVIGVTFMMSAAAAPAEGPSPKAHVARSAADNAPQDERIIRRETGSTAGHKALARDAIAETRSTPDRAGPPQGGFNWKKLAGKYDFGECRSRPSAIWSDGPPGSFIQIEHRLDYTRNGPSEGLELMRASSRSPIALGWSLERIGEGRQTETDVRTGKIGKVMESYATDDGVYGVLTWNRPHNVGWSTLQLRLSDQGIISLTIRQRNDGDASTREETCTLQKYVPKIPV